MTDKTKSEAMAAALALPCAEHGAGAGAYCFDDPKSRVRGVCAPRYAKGRGRAALQQPTGPAPAPFKDALEERARAARNVQLHERQREHERQSQERANMRPVNRGGLRR